MYEYDKGNQHRGQIGMIGDLLLEIKNHPNAGVCLHLSNANLNWHQLVFIEKLKLFKRKKFRKGKRINFELTEKGKIFLHHYSKLRLILMSDS